MSKALLLVDLQNDYFPGGTFPLWNTDQVLENIKKTIEIATKRGIHIIHIQHVADKSQGSAPFFNENTIGVAIHPEILKIAPHAPIITKHYADSFFKTNLDEVLNDLNVEEIFVCGMMTQNCVTHTAISKSAEKYKTSILMDCSTTVSEILHLIALHAVSTRISLIHSVDVL